MKTIYVNSAGCTENIIDGAIIKRISASADYSFIDDPQKADLIVFNTCAFKRKQEDRSIRMIKHYQNIKKKNARLVVCGCLVMINKERLDSVFQGVKVSPTDLNTFYEVVDLPVSNDVREVSFITKDISDKEMFGVRASIEHIYRLKRSARKWLKINILPNFDLLEYIGDESTWYVRIARGCINSCGYCAIRFAQGRLKSQPLQSVLDTVKVGIAKGYKKIFLVATNSSAYGIDIGTDFLTLLGNIIDLEGDFKIMIHNYEPFGMLVDPERFLKIFSSPKIHSFYCPLNSGSQFVLNRMNRSYDIKKIMDLIKQLRKRNPLVLVRTEIISGYPGEKWSNFFETVKTIMSFKFNQIDLHVYSSRPNTPASKLDGQVSMPVKLLRHLILWVIIFFRVWLRRLKPISFKANDEDWKHD